MQLTEYMPVFGEKCYFQQDIKFPQPNLTHWIIVDHNMGPYMVYSVQTVSAKFSQVNWPFRKTCQGSAKREFFSTSDLITA